MRFLFSCSNLGKEAAKLRKLKRYKPTKFMAEGSRYDKEAADAAVTFINCLKHTKGEWYGMPFELIDWQEQIVRDIFGILKPNGYRQFNTAYIEIPKKQGKSELAAAIALYLTCGDFEHEVRQIPHHGRLGHVLYMPPLKAPDKNCLTVYKPAASVTALV
jgi:phage terminase large subunit-like protein